jgi:hypothetical protein
MALSELAAVEAAFQVLHPLDAAGRRRALHWLSDALGAEGPLQESVPETAAPAARVGDDRAAQRAPVKATSTRTRPRSASTDAQATKTTAAGETRAGRPPRRQVARPAATPAESPERMYRRMPPADVVMAAYEQVGTVSGLADHFDVPRHTVQGWARQLRKQGHAIGRAS